MKFYGLLLFSFLASCSTSHQENKLDKRLISSWTPTYAKGFSIQFYNTHNELILLDLQTGTDTLEIIHIPLNEQPSAALLSTTHVSYMDKLNCLPQVNGVAFASLVKNKNATELIHSGKIVDLSGADDVDIEKLVALNPKWFFVYPYGHGNYDKYTSKGISCIPVSEYLETHPLGRAEWIYAFAVVMNKWEQADAYFKEVTQKYQELKAMTDTIPDTSKPCVFSGSDHGGTWFAAPGNSFQGTWINDAGGKYLFSDSLSSNNIQLPFEQLFKAVFNCDFWGRIDARTTPLTLKDVVLEDSRFKDVKSVKDQQVFYCNTNVADYFGDAVVEPEIILSDLIHIFHPLLLPNYQPAYFKRLTP